ncbi:hypothetical protein TKK_0013319 [Trichogramma kaykai]
MKKTLFIICFLVSLVHGVHISSRKLNCNEITADESIDSFDVEFYLSTYDKQDPVFINLRHNLSTFLNVRKFNPYLRTAVVVHGFLNSHETSWVERLTESMHKYERMNIILVNWSDAFDFPFVYRSAALSTRKTANETSKLIMKMASDLQVPLKNWTYLHFIGHSLGAHVVGQAARLLKMSNHRPAVHRITGLDPANPCFNDVKVAFRLRKSDARFVDIIHTNSAPGLNPNFGLYDRIGHVDFYINGGNNQPSCATRFLPANIPFLSDPGDLIEDLESFLENNFIGLLGQFSSNLMESDYNMICNHLQAPEFFIDSMNPKIIMWGSPVELPITKVNDSLKCENRNCSLGRKCIKIGMAMRGIVEEGAYFVDQPRTKLALKKCKRLSV